MHDLRSLLLLLGLTVGVFSYDFHVFVGKWRYRPFSHAVQNF